MGLTGETPPDREARPLAFPWPLATDQERCYDDRGRALDCEGSGQDAAAGTSGQSAASRFLLRGDVVSDTATGLRWCRDANPFEFPYSWREAFDLVAAMNRAAAHGRDDWRLPSRRELFSLVSHQHINPALPAGHPFDNVFPGYYWTAEACAGLPAQTWYVHLGGGRVYRGMQNGAYLVWPVSGRRRSDPRPEHRFRSADGVIHDRRTGLAWSRQTLGTSPTSWAAALAAAGQLNRARFKGFSGWRLPNIRELESLVDLSRHAPALPTGHPFDSVPEGCWSSTTSVYEPRYAWVLYPRDGAVGVGYKPEATFSAWAVTAAPAVGDAP